uniref:Dimer_Tnp_hAT domain-containing protein n=1 Tax=Panagrellus redivivus TaxID=6233 RepID=A0A7E4WB12_PANRE
MLLFSDNSPLEEFEGAKTTKAASVAYRGMLEGLVPPAGCSVLVISVMEVLTEYFERQFGIYLGDDFCDLGDQLKGVPLTNAACESMFSAVDWSYRRQPNMNIRKRAAHTAIIKNRTFRYLMSLSEEERQEILKKAVSNRSAIESLERRKSAEYATELIKAMEAKESERARNRKKLQNKKDKLLRDIQTVGIWKSVAELEAVVASLKHTKAMEAVKLNIRFHKLHQKGKDCDEGLFKFQKAGHKYTLAELIAHLSELIEMNGEDDDTSVAEDSDLEGISDVEGDE